MELNREQIIKDLECCTSEKHKCCECSYCRDEYFCDREQFKKDTLSLIKELTEDNAGWKEIAEGYQKQFEDCYEEKVKLTEENERLRADTVREFAERLKKYYSILNSSTNSNLVAYHIDQVAKEILEGDKSG